ncbi:MAG: hypothetical protein Q7R66_15060 [Undibacterium sp.]|uniref:hypothetical protein n=1 Tax=Undibacterium sp. TaxID=1914977 RepID=UPI00271E6A65|nr:hypothetical protein [Undibacterium sp.]MDO8653501.1 hypothetical protein [Undibacterium sp.]
MKTYFKLVLVVLFTGVTAACGTLPDAKPFAEASNTLAHSVKASGQAVSDSLVDAGGDATAFAGPLQKAWQERVNAVQAASQYASEIANLVAAGNEGAETVKRVADTLGVLAQTAGIPVAGPVAGVLGDIGQAVAERIASVKSSRTLAQAVAQAQPAIDVIANHLSEDVITGLKPILKSAYDNTVSMIKSEYGDDNAFAKQLSAKKLQLRTAAVQDQKNIAALLEFERMSDTVAGRLKERDQKLEQASVAYKTRVQLVNALVPAIDAWARAHRDVASAIIEKRKVTVTELRETVSDLKELIRKVRAL